MSKVTQGDFLNACDKMIVAAEANPGEPVDGLRIHLESDAEGIREAQARRSFHQSEAQKASRDLDRYLGSARLIYSRLRHLLIALFGLRAEELVKYGIQPLRPPKTKAEPTPPPVEDKKMPPENGWTPTQAAHPQTESSS
jgi:hypothetical protein